MPHSIHQAERHGYLSVSALYRAGPGNRETSSDGHKLIAPLLPEASHGLATPSVIELPVAGLTPEVFLLVDAILERQTRNAAFWSARLKGFDGPAASPAEIQCHIDWSKHEYTHTELYREIFLAALC